MEAPTRSPPELCSDSFICEPIIFHIDDDGEHIISEPLPLRTIIDVQGVPFRRRLLIDDLRGTVTINLNIKVTYKRIAFDIHDHWICEKC